MDPARSQGLANGADAITAARLLAAVIVVPLIASGELALVALLVALAWITNLLDGRLARLSGLSTRLGNFDLVADTAFGAGVVIGLMNSGQIPVWLGISALVVFGSLFAGGNVAAAMLLQLTGFVPLLVLLWQERPLTWWTPFLVALVAGVIDWRRLVFMNIPAFVKGLTGRSELR